MKNQEQLFLPVPLTLPSCLPEIKHAENVYLPVNTLDLFLHKLHQKAKRVDYRKTKITFEDLARRKEQKLPLGEEWVHIGEFKRHGTCRRWEDVVKPEVVPGLPQVVQRLTSHFPVQGCEFHPWLGSSDPTCRMTKKTECRQQKWYCNTFNKGFKKWSTSKINYYSQFSQKRKEKKLKNFLNYTGTLPWTQSDQLKESDSIRASIS